jgi:hypothetical protein
MFCTWLRCCRFANDTQAEAERLPSNQNFWCMGYQQEKEEGPLLYLGLAESELDDRAKQLCKCSMHQPEQQNIFKRFLTNF